MNSMKYIALLIGGGTLAALMLVGIVAFGTFGTLAQPLYLEVHSDVLHQRRLLEELPAAAGTVLDKLESDISDARALLLPPSWQQQDLSALVPSPPADRIAALAVLQAQMRGKWTASSTSTCARSLLPKERERMDRSAKLGNLKDPKCRSSDDTSVSLTTRLGHQCGCHAEAPTALHEWQQAFWQQASSVAADETCARTSESSNAYSSLDLIRSLRGRTTCFVGDSITMQLYDALRHNLLRLAMLRPELDLVVRDSNADELPFVNSTDRSRGVARWWWGGLKEVGGFIVTSSGSGHASRRVASAETSIRLYKQYVWSPWDAELIASDCDIILYNIALHYNIATLKGRNGNPYRTDLRGAMTWLVNFSRTPGKTAIWRESLPQHFRTIDGTYGGRGAQEPGCVKRGMGVVPGNLGTSVVWPKQRYNNVTAAIWEELCGPPTTMGVSHRCNAAALMRRDESGEFGESLLQWWRTNKYTAQLEHYAVTKKKKKKENELVGEVWEWPVFELFDEAYEFHSSLGDCTHYCFVPELFNAAYETLRRVLDLTDLASGQHGTYNVS